MSAQLLIETPWMRNEVVQKNGTGYVKKHGFLNNPSMILVNGGGPTNSILFKSLLMLENWNWCQIKA